MQQHPLPKFGPVEMMPPEKLTPGKNIRTYVDPKAQAELTASMAAVGIYVPLLASAELSIVDGYRRWLAAKDLGLEAVPVVVLEGDFSEEQITEIQLAITMHRQDVGRMEKTMAMHFLEKSKGVSRQELARRAGVSPGTITKILRPIDRLAPDLLARVVEGTIDPSAAYQLSLLEPNDQRKVVGEADEKGWSVRNIVARVREIRGKYPARAKAKKKPKPSRTDHHYAVRLGTWIFSPTHSHSDDLRVARESATELVHRIDDMIAQRKKAKSNHALGEELLA
jgi:ParB/RepB/Spo0J family partition protein